MWPCFGCFLGTVVFMLGARLEARLLKVEPLQLGHI